ncbi:hypothetical protein FZC78_06490 [Rossellomorea vietnamensis]|uniref:Uncharacterized protein n=1 Tax=Rossellomorea vietnamensis TaxID=218284 RepID=A0A5D4NXU6_9BACI|nr:hypothetical protein [Rossellomorea vietnamensis]TYS17522.1 hypothetical protein FZC78_06490 [Rossellomorea vietnamensis]
MIPSLNNRGKLPIGIHNCSGEDVIYRYCNTEIRKRFQKPITDLLNFAFKTNAEYLFIGGSFITNELDPNDIDCLIVYNENKQIPNNKEEVLIGGMHIDLMFASLENRSIIDAYLHLFSHNRFSEEVGVLQIDLLKENKIWKLKPPGKEKYEVIKSAYIDRHILNVRECKGVLVTIHGLLSSGQWNKEIAPIASSEGWIIAPYIYVGNTPSLLINKRRRSKIVNEFREWICDLGKRYKIQKLFQ